MKWMILLIAAVAFISGCTGQQTSQPINPEQGFYTPSAEEGNTQGKLAKDFSLVTIEGDAVRLSDFRGKYVLFASMATWCIPCQIEARNVKQAQDNFPHLPLVVIQYDVDPRETKEDLARFREDFGREDWIMGFDDGSIVRLYNVRTFDTTVVVDPSGKIIYRDDGFPIDAKTLEDLIVKGESTQLQLGSTHEHADITVILGGKETDFSQDKYQLRSSFVHFEDGNGKEVHVHAKGVTVGYLFGTLGWEYSFKLGGESCLKTDFDELCGGKLIITVNVTEKNLDYEIKEGDVIEVAYK